MARDKLKTVGAADSAAQRANFVSSAIASAEEVDAGGKLFKADSVHARLAARVQQIEAAAGRAPYRTAPRGSPK
ncbi:MAG: hypothetical protein LW847_01200 [Burkholderiales bacterium]|jgi:hypothetical protein|nr:hypothetical protein [Burkholderiales bacterium]